MNLIYHLKQARFPEFRFEYHFAAKRVYYIRANSPGIGRVMAMNVENEGQAQNAVLVFLRGYQEARDGIEYTVTEAAA